MAIVSGIDFSPNSLAAAEAAAAIARRLGDELVLVHADAFLADLPESGRIAWLEPVRERLRATAERLRQAGAAVSEEILAWRACRPPPRPRTGAPLHASSPPPPAPRRCASMTGVSRP